MTLLFAAILIASTSAHGQTLVSAQGEEINYVVPLGIDPPANPRGTSASFHIDIRLPAGVSKQLHTEGSEFRLAIEGELLPGVPAPQTPAGYPRSALQTHRRDGSADPRPVSLVMRHDFPEELYEQFKYQTGAKRFVSPIIIAIADPRASINYKWPAGADKRAAGCHNCDRPPGLEGKTEADGVYEIYTAGRFISVRPDSTSTGNVFTNTSYSYLGEKGRLDLRVLTVIADTVRPTSVLVAANAPPIAGGLLQEATYVHSGEVESSATDLDTGGRAGWNVVVDRTYRSRTIGLASIGAGWDSTLFRRVRLLPNSNVEYRDGQGEIWLFKSAGGGKYDPPKGLQLALTRRTDGFTLIDQKWRITEFDEYGRLKSETDEFYDPTKPGSGNKIHYLYNAAGRLSAIIDPVGRQTKLTYYEQSSPHAGLVKEIEDWRTPARKVSYEYDPRHLLKVVRLPEAKAADGVPGEFDLTGAQRPKFEYAYQPAGASYNDQLELATNLKTIKEASVDSPRVTFEYDLSSDPLLRDRVTVETWGTGETARFEYPSASKTIVTDALRQKRTYELTSPEQYDKRVHVSKMTEHDVLVIPTGALPASAPTTLPAAPRDLVTAVGDFNEHGQPLMVTYPNGLTTTYGFEPAKGGAAGTVLRSRSETGANTSTQTQYTFEGEEAGASSFAVAPGAANTVAAVGRSSEVSPLVIRDAQSPSRSRAETLSNDGEINVVTTTKYNRFGQVTDVMQQPSPGAEAVIAAQTVYYDHDAPSLLDRSRPVFVKKGADLEKYNLIYSHQPLGGEKIELRDMLRNTLTEKILDAYGRETSVIVKEDSGRVVTDERFGYDGAGRLRYHARKQSPLGLVETRIDYDEMGREKERTTSQAEVNGSLTTLTARTEWDPGVRKVTRFDPVSGGGGEARETQLLDGLGRPLVIERTGGTDRIRSQLGYDAASNVVWESDGRRLAVQREFDGLGRIVAEVAADGTRSETTWSAWNEPLEHTARDASGAIVAHTKNGYTRMGRLRSTREDIGGQATIQANAEEAPNVRETLMGWSNGGKTTTSRTGVAGAFRVLQSELDGGGRVVSTLIGGAANRDDPVTDLFARQDVTSYRGSVPYLVSAAEPKANATYEMSLGHDGLGRPTSALEAGFYSTTTDYDEAGNALVVQRPGYAPEEAKYDSRGLVRERRLADGKVLRYQHDALGNVREVTDESGEITKYEPDSLGRIRITIYADGTSEEVVYEADTGAIAAQRDRANQWLSYTRDAGGRVVTVNAGQDAATSPVLLRNDYDGVGRLVRVRNRDAGIAYEGYDLLGRATITRTFRYTNGTGLETAPAEPTVLDVHTQRHEWNVHDERQSWRMPAAGTVVPEDDPTSRWLQTIKEEHDAGANLIALKKPDGLLMFEGEARSAGRLKGRKVWTSGRVALTTSYGYADGSAPAVPLPPTDNTLRATGLPLWSASSVNGVRVAGSSNARDGAKRLDATLDLGLGNRSSSWDYDDRGRLTDAWLGLSGSGATSVTDTLVDADFRAKRSVPAALSAAQHAILGDAFSLALEPPAWTATKTPSAHRTDTRTLYLDGTAKETRTYSYLGARRTSDGVWTYTFDELGRLTTAASTTLGRKIEFTWDPNDRLVGRTAYREGSTGWVPEDRADVLSHDGVPAEVTFVWDPMVDRLVAMFARGASTAPGASAAAGLIRQYLHGDNGYDDPVQVRVANTSGQTPAIYYPIVDESGTGSLAAIIGDDGTLVERVLYADSYGDAPRYLQGAVVDKITLDATKDNAGNLTNVKVRVHLSEQIDDATLPSGVRLASVKADNTIAQTAGISPTLEDEYTILWSLSGGDWNALTSVSGAQSLEVAVTRSLLARGWGNTPVSPTPSWALKLYSGTASTAMLPVIKHEPLSLLTGFIESVGNGATQTYPPLYEIPSLYLAANEESKAKLLTGFHSAPYVEPANGLVLFRDRWYDASTGSWMTPDAEGYAAGSSNLYAGFLNDPVSHRDPTGNEPITATAAIAYLGNVALQTGIDVGIDWAWNAGSNWWERNTGGTETEFDWHDSLQTNFSINLVSAGFGGKLKHLAKLRNPILRKLATEGAEYAVDVAATGTIDMALHDQSASEAFGTAAVGGLVGRGVSHGIGAALGRSSRRSGYAPLMPRYDDPSRGFGARFDSALNEAGFPPLPSGWQRHHTVQQRMAQPAHPFNYLASGRDVHHPSLLRGALAQKHTLAVTDPSGRIRRTHPHAEMDREIREFLQRNPSRRDYDSFLDYMDWRWQHTFWEMGAGH